MAAFAVLGAVPLSSQQDDNEEFRLRVETDLVVLHVTVNDKNNRPVADLKQEQFRIFEDKAEQELKVFRREDVPVSVGILVDNSGSMRNKRKGVNAAAMQFVKSSNANDEVFIVNFNDEAFLDTDFTDNLVLLNEGLEKIGSRGGTALYDALELSLSHLAERATNDKQVLIAITDGEDNASLMTLEKIVQDIQKTNVMIYTAGLLGADNKREMRRARRALEAIAKASGGSVYFPGNPREVEEMATRIANDIRNQYVLAYSPTDPEKDGGFRRIEIKLDLPSRDRLTVRARSGYYAVDTAPDSEPISQR